MKIIIESHQKQSSKKTGIGYYEKILSGQLEKLISKHDTLTFGAFADSEKKPSKIPVEYSNLSKRFVIKLQSYGIRIGASKIWKPAFDIYIYPDFCLFPLRKGSKSIVVIHDLAFLLYPEHLPQRSRLLNFINPSLATLLKRCVPYAVNKSDTIITTSERVKQEVCNNYGISPKKIIVSGIPPEDHFKPRKKSKIKIKEIPTKKFIYYQATLEPRKNHVNLLEAYRLLPKKFHEEYSLVLGGGLGWNYEQTQTSIDRLISEGLPVVQLGYVSDAEKLRLYQQAELYIQPSHYEGFGMPLLEAMACSTPVLCSDIPVFREVCGKGAVYFDKGHPADIASKIDKTLKNKKKLESLIQLGHERVKFYKEDTLGLEQLLNNFR